MPLSHYNQPILYICSTITTYCPSITSHLELSFSFFSWLSSPVSCLLSPGQSQYRAFLLLKALQTISRTYAVKRGLRAIRANADTPARQKHCRLRSFTMSLESHVIGPSVADINNCHGACSFPMLNTTNHAVLLNSYIDSKRAANEAVDQRAPCCVPVAYEDLDMVLLDEAGTGTELRTLTDVVVKECGCR